MSCQPVSGIGQHCEPCQMLISRPICLRHLYGVVISELVSSTAGFCVRRSALQCSLAKPAASSCSMTHLLSLLPTNFFFQAEARKTSCLKIAELATAGSLVGLISLSIQSCQGLTSYYSAWKSYDEQIGHTYRILDELRTTCEILKHELQRITQYQEPAVQQVVRLIASCQDGINGLRHALEECHSAQMPHNLTAKLELYRARALYPFKKQTLKTLKDNVHSVQGNLSSALQVLQL